MLRGRDPTGKPLRERRREGFLRRIRGYFKTTRYGEPDVDPAEVARAVFRALARKVSEGEIERALRILPRELRELWPEIHSV